MRVNVRWKSIPHSWAASMTPLQAMDFRTPLFRYSSALLPGLCKLHRAQVITAQALRTLLEDLASLHNAVPHHVPTSSRLLGRRGVVGLGSDFRSRSETPVEKSCVSPNGHAVRHPVPAITEIHARRIGAISSTRKLPLLPLLQCSYCIRQGRARASRCDCCLTGTNPRPNQNSIRAAFCGHSIHPHPSTLHPANIRS
jgi:hypothetical protein